MPSPDLFLCVCVHICVSVCHMCADACGGQKSVLHPVEQLWTAGHGSKNQTWVLWKSKKLLTTELSPSSMFLFLTQCLMYPRLTFNSQRSTYLSASRLFGFKVWATMPEKPWTLGSSCFCFSSSAITSVCLLASLTPKIYLTFYVIYI